MGGNHVMKRIGMLTSGGDCQALNAAMRGVVKSILNAESDVEIYGFLDGYKGLIYGNFRMLTGHDFSGILTKGGTILGSSRTPFKLMREPDENGLDKVEAMKQNYYKLQLDCLVILGGNGTHRLYPYNSSFPWQSIYRGSYGTQSWLADIKCRYGKWCRYHPDPGNPIQH